MVKKICDYKGIPIYEDVYSDGDKILLGSKGGVEGYQYAVVGPEIASILKRMNRSDKLDELLKGNK